MPALLENEFILLVGIILLGLGGLRLKALTLSGAVGTFLVGIFIALGFKGYGLLLIGVFFVTSSLWSKYNRKRKENLQDMHEKGSQRDIVQVLANGAVPALIGILAFLFPSEYWLYGFVTAIAVANSDTWASEIGSLSRKEPISIFSFQKVKTGTSGAISLLGTVAALLGSAIIGGTALLLWDELDMMTVFILILFGVVGCFIDTVLGATVQASYQCQSCGAVVEKKQHCHQPADLIKGYSWMNNDAVNISAILFASMCAYLVGFGWL